MKRLIKRLGCYWRHRPIFSQVPQKRNWYLDDEEADEATRRLLAASSNPLVEEFMPLVTNLWKVQLKEVAVHTVCLKPEDCTYKDWRSSCHFNKLRNRYKGVEFKNFMAQSKLTLINPVFAEIYICKIDSWVKWKHFCKKSWPKWR